MKSETQAFHLAKIMQRHIFKPSYELALPLVEVSKKKLKKLSLDDVLLIGLDRLDLILLDGDKMCANIQLKKLENSYETEIIGLEEQTILSNDSKKYKALKLSFGTVKSKALELGQNIDIKHLDLDRVKLVLKDTTIAEGSLVIVDEEIAVQIKKVN